MADTCFGVGGSNGRFAAVNGEQRRHRFHVPQRHDRCLPPPAMTVRRDDGVTSQRQLEKSSVLASRVVRKPWNV